jgi:hypothetical protein
MSMQKHCPAGAVLPLPRTETSIVVSVSRYCNQNLETTNLPTHLPRLRMSAATSITLSSYVTSYRGHKTLSVFVNFGR